MMTYKILLMCMLLSFISCGRKNQGDDDGSTVGLDLAAIDTKNAAPLRGYQEINRALSERLFGNPNNLALSIYLEPQVKEIIFDDGVPFFGLTDLLGGYNGDGMKSERENSAPNGVNMLLWLLVTNGFASDIGSLCEGNHTFDSDAFHSSQMNPNFKNTLLSACELNSNSTNTRDVLQKFWSSIALADVPDGEFEGWYQFAQKEVLPHTNGKEAVRQLFVAMVYTPHFLVKK